VKKKERKETARSDACSGTRKSLMEKKGKKRKRRETDTLFQFYIREGRREKEEKERTRFCPYCPGGTMNREKGKRKRRGVKLRYYYEPDISTGKEGKGEGCR